MSGYQNVSLRLGYGSVDHDDHPTFTNLGRVFQFFDIFRGGGGGGCKKNDLHFTIVVDQATTKLQQMRI